MRDAQGLDTVEDGTTARARFVGTNSPCVCFFSRSSVLFVFTYVLATGFSNFNLKICTQIFTRHFFVQIIKLCKCKIGHWQCLLRHFNFFPKVPNVVYLHSFSYALFKLK